VPAGFSVYGQPHQITVNVVGDQHAISVDGKRILSFSDSTFKSGSAGLLYWDGNESVNHISAKALSNGGGSGDLNQGDFAYACSDQNTSYGLAAGWPGIGSSSCSHCNRRLGATRRSPAFPRGSAAFSLSY